MKKMLFLVLAIVIASTLVFASCGEKAATTAPAPATSTSAPSPGQLIVPSGQAPGSTQAPAGTAAPATGGPKVQGSIIRIMNQGPTVLGYPPEFGPNENYAAVYTLDTLFFLDSTTGKYEGAIAESWNIDQKASTITLNIRKGVKFHDGTPCDAEAVKWNCQLNKDAKILYFTYIESMDVLDPNTLRLNMNHLDITSMTMMSSTGMISPTAYKNSGTTEDARKIWARANVVGTGPYKLVDYKRDSYIKFTRNDDYWRTGKPYVKNVTVNVIPDTMIASALLQAGDADVWWSNANIAPTAVDLEKKGFGVNWYPGGIAYFILFNSADPNKPWHDANVRAAVEYAINRPELANLVGYGHFIPLTRVASPGSLADPGGDPHPFSVQKAKDLLKEAGYPSGFKTTLLTQPRDAVTSAAIQGYLKAVGIDCTLDVADTARYYNQIWTKTGWSDITVVLMPLARDNNEIIFQMGSRPLNFKADCFYKTPKLLDLAEKALTYPTYESAKDIMKQMIQEYSDQTLCIALFNQPYSMIYNNIPGIAYHTNFLTPVEGSTWRVWNDWTEKTK
jgi:peptide/nickel transport system substrate-binding protein